MALTQGLGLIGPVVRLSTPTSPAEAREVIGLIGRTGAASHSTGLTVLAAAAVIGVRTLPGVAAWLAAGLSDHPMGYGPWSLAMTALLVTGGIAAGVGLWSAGRRVRDGNVARDPLRVARGLRRAMQSAALMAAIAAAGVVWTVGRCVTIAAVPDDAVIVGFLSLAQMVLCLPLLYGAARLGTLHADASALVAGDRAGREP